MQIEIRKMNASDAQGLYEAIIESIDHVSEWMTWCTSDYALEEAEDWTASAEDKWVDGTEYRFLAISKDTKEILGCFGIGHVHPERKSGDLGYWVRKTALGKGVAKKASRLVTKYAFDELGFQRIEVCVLPENTHSIAVAESLGGTFEGTFRNKLIHDGVSKSAKCFSIIPEDFQ